MVFKALDIKDVPYVIKGITRLYNRYSFNDTNENIVEKSLKDTISYDKAKKIYIGFKNNTPVAYVSYEIIQNNKAEISGGLLLNNYNGKSLSSVGFNFLEKKLTKLNIEHVIIRVIKNHYKVQAILRLYRIYGYKKCNIDENYIHLEKTLPYGSVSR